MNLYLVRFREGRKIQGVFWAQSKAALWDAVDEMADPALFEMAKITKPGGVYHDVPLDEQPPYPSRSDFPPGQAGDDAYCDQSDKAWPPAFNQCGEFLMHMIDGQDDLRWTPFDHFDEGVGMLARIRRTQARKNNRETA